MFAPPAVFAGSFIASAPEPWALIVSLVNPHDVLGYPSSYEQGGYRLEDFRDIEVPLPETFSEDLSSKPDPHSLMKLGQASYLGPLRGRRADEARHEVGIPAPRPPGHPAVARTGRPAAAMLRAWPYSWHPYSGSRMPLPPTGGTSSASD